MTKRTTSRARLLRSVVCLTLCLGLLVGTTFAWFSDEASTGKTTITAGNLDIQFQQMNDQGEFEESDAAIFDEEEFSALLWEPGVMEVSNVFTVYNAGNLYLQYAIAADNVEATTFTWPGGTPYSYSTVSLDEAIQMIIVGKDDYDAAVSAIEGLSDAIVNNTVTYAQRLALWESLQAGGNAPGLITDYSEHGVLAPGEYVGGVGEDNKPIGQVAVLFWEEQGDETDNKYNIPKDDEQGPLELRAFGLNVFATQTPYEADSFGDQYDNIVFAASSKDVEDAFSKFESDFELVLDPGVKWTSDIFDFDSLNPGVDEVLIKGGDEGDTVIIIDPTNSTLSRGLNINLPEDKKVTFSDVTIDGEYIREAYGSGYGGVINVTGGTVEFDNVTMIDGGESTNDSSILVTGNDHSSKIIIKDSNISGSFRGVFFASDSSDPNNPHELIIENSTIEAPYTFNVMGVHTKITVRNSTLQGGTTYSNGGMPVLFENVTFSKCENPAIHPYITSTEFPVHHVFSYNDTTFSGCKFVGTDFYIGGQGETSTHSYDNCFMGANGDVPVTAENVKRLYTTLYWPSCYLPDNQNVSIRVNGVDIEENWSQDDVAGRSDPA